MLALIIIFGIIFYNMPKDNRASALIKLLIGGAVALCILSAILDSPIGVLALIGLIVYLVKKGKENKKAKQRKEEYGWDPQRWDKENGNASTADTVRQQQYQERAQRRYEDRNTAQNTNTAYSNVERDAAFKTAERSANYGQSRQALRSTLPKSIKKRRKILEAFDKKYNLCLTSQQMDSIVNSSYLSATWKTELEAMDKKYMLPGEWFQGPTSWLRVYMLAFHIQEITSDFRQQENIVMYAFEQVFRYVDSLPPMPLYQQIERVNDKFFTSFDDMSFMIAYRYLESKGIKHELKEGRLINNNDLTEDLEEKYTNMTFDEENYSEDITVLEEETPVEESFTEEYAEKGYAEEYSSKNIDEMLQQEGSVYRMKMK